MKNESVSNIFPNEKIFVARWNEDSDSRSGDELWNYLLNDDVNWLAEVDDNEDGEPDAGRAKVVKKNDRKSTDFRDNRFEGGEALVESILDLHSIGVDPVNTDAVFTGRQEIKEGWMKLRRVVKSDV